MGQKKRHGDVFDEDDRSLMWITAQKLRNRQYQDDAIEEVGEKIVSYFQKYLTRTCILYNLYKYGYILHMRIEKNMI